MAGIKEDVIDAKEILVSNDISGYDAASGALLNETVSQTNPTLVPKKSDKDTGIGSKNNDQLSLISGGVEAIRLSEASNKILQVMEGSSSVGLTADVGSIQGGGVILASYNVFDTVGTAGDSATLPAIASVGTIVYIKNGAAANSMDVFPAAGDDLGQGANTQEALAAGDFAVYIATTANSVWEKLMGGTA